MSSTLWILLIVAIWFVFLLAAKIQKTIIAVRFLKVAEALAKNCDSQTANRIMDELIRKID